MRSAEPAISPHAYASATAGIVSAPRVCPSTQEAHGKEVHAAKYERRAEEIERIVFDEPPVEQPFEVPCEDTVATVVVPLEIVRLRDAAHRARVKVSAPR